jgi:hypothetical protein
LNPRIQKAISEREKLTRKVADYQTRIRELDRQILELENADIVAMVRGVDIPPDEFAAFVRMFHAQKGGAVPNLEPQNIEEKDEEESPIED